MANVTALLGNNQMWAAGVRSRDPEFFGRQEQRQTPEFLWIGCSDSRVAANQIVGLLPGKLFVHRNIANVVSHTDLNGLSVIEYAIDVLGVRDVIVCGHHGCGGVRGALSGASIGLIDNWLRLVREVARKHEAVLARHADPDLRADVLSELNVIEQVATLCRTTVVEAAWARGARLAVHGWVYSLHDGLLEDLGVSVDGAAGIDEAYREALLRYESLRP